MRLYSSMGPNPRVVTLFMREKHIDIATIEVDIRGGENRQPDYLAINPAGQLPALKLDNGEVLTESTVICEYLEDIYPTPPLVGTTAEEKAEVRMWCRRIDLMVNYPLLEGFRASEGYEFFKDRIFCMTGAADELKQATQNGLDWIDRQLGEHEWLCGERFTLADILLFCLLDFAGQVGQSAPADASRLNAWLERVKQRQEAIGQ